MSEASKSIIITAIIDKVSVDREGAAKVMFSVPQDDAAKVALLTMLTEKPLKVTIEEMEVETHGRPKK